MTLTSLSSCGAAMKQTEDKGKCLCRTCGKRFRRLSGFDKHLSGPYGQRRCLTTARMQELGFTQDSNGRWMAKSRKGTKQAHWRAQ